MEMRTCVVKRVRAHCAAESATPGTVLGGSPADFRKLIADDTEKGSNVIRVTNSF
jgi:hypothetical protein